MTWLQLTHRWKTFVCKYSTKSQAKFNKTEIMCSNVRSINCVELREDWVTEVLKEWFAPDKQAESQAQQLWSTPTQEVAWDYARKLTTVCTIKRDIFCGHSILVYDICCKCAIAWKRCIRWQQDLRCNKWAYILSVQANLVSFSWSNGGGVNFFRNYVRFCPDFTI